MGVVGSRRTVKVLKDHAVPDINLNITPGKSSYLRLNTKLLILACINFNLHARAFLLDKNTVVL